MAKKQNLSVVLATAVLNESVEGQSVQSIVSEAWKKDGDIKISKDGKTGTYGKKLSSTLVTDKEGKEHFIVSAPTIEGANNIILAKLESGAITPELATEARRTLNKRLARAAKALELPKLAVKGSKRKGYAVELVEEKEAEKKTFETALNELIATYTSDGVALAEIQGILIEQSNKIDTFLKQGQKAVA